jgi:hypothetical protein
LCTNGTKEESIESSVSSSFDHCLSLLTSNEKFVFWEEEDEGIACVSFGESEALKKRKSLLCFWLKWPEGN